MTLASLGADRGAVLAAGPRPVLGSHDPAGASELAPYRAVGKLLAPLRLPDDELELLDIAGLDDEDQTRAWYVRFFSDARA